MPGLSRYMPHCFLAEAPQRRYFCKNLINIISMKKLIVAFAVVCSLMPLCAKAQASEAAPAEKAAKAEFNPHWFLQLQAGGAYAVGEAKDFKDLLSPAAAVSAGYRFNPLLGLRLGVGGWQARGGWADPARNYKFDYIQTNLDVMLSLTNLFCGFNDRFLDAYLFAGFGGAVGLDNDEAVAMNAGGAKFEKLWTGKKFFPAGRAGIGLNFNVSRTVSVGLELNANMLPDNFNSKKGSVCDWQYNALLGLTYSFGGRTKKAVVTEPEPEVIAPRPAVVQEPEPQPQPEPAPAPKPVVKPAPMVQNVFFTINSSRIRKDEQSKIDSIVEYMKENPDATVVVTGYADKETGTTTYNMAISGRRAKAVADAIVAAGIEASRVTTVAKGDTEQPFEGRTRNRVAVALTQF